MIYYYRTKDLKDFKDFIFFIEARVDHHITINHYSIGDLIVYDNVLNELRWSDAYLCIDNKVELTKEEMLGKLMLLEL